MLSSARLNAGSGPNASQTTNVNAAIGPGPTGTKYAGDHVGEALDRRPRALRVRDEPDDLGEDRVGADARRAEGERAGRVERAADDQVAAAACRPAGSRR